MLNGACTALNIVQDARRSKKQESTIHFVFYNFNTVFTKFGVYFQIQSETETIDFPVNFDMAAVRRVNNAPRW